MWGKIIGLLEPWKRALPRGAKLKPLWLSLFLIISVALTSAQQPNSTAGLIYKKAAPSVVLIELLDDKGEVKATGSGFVVSGDGKIITNYHVIAHFKHATVRLANKDAYDTVDVLDIDKRKDIAVLKIKGSDLPFLSLGKSSVLEIGDKVFSLTNPLGVLENTLSEGIVSGIRLGDGYRYFQISAPISHGSSGGPIFNSQGDVIAIAAATIEEGQNLNFAVPIDYAKGMLSSNLARPLAAVYEPEPEPAPHAAALAANNAVPEEMKNDGFSYLQSKLHVWKEPEARKAYGEPIRQRDFKGEPPLEIFAYSDPSKKFREVELSFNSRTGFLQNIIMYPWAVPWEQVKSVWGDKVWTRKQADGSKLYLFKDKNANVRVGADGQVISVQIF